MKIIEDLNPRSRPVVQMRKTVERCLDLKDLIAEHVHRCREVGMDYDDPPTWGSLPFVHVEHRGYISTLVRQLWGDNYWTHPEYRSWPVLVEMWRTGSLDRQIQDLGANLPRSVREKLNV